MDFILPTCAQLRPAGTVITKTYRIRSARTNFVTPDKCELCGRTRNNNQYSDCVSETVKKCRPHRSSTSAARSSRYVNVCAAVCLLLLVGDFSPQSAAAPRFRRNNMQENAAWANPCDYDLNSSPSPSRPFTRDQAKRVANQAKSALENAQSFKDKFAQIIQSNEKFSESWDTTAWLQSIPYVNEYIFPEKKKISPEYLSAVTSNIEDYLPAMYKTLKLVAAGLYAIKEYGLKQDVVSEMDLKPNFEQSFNAVRLVLCEFNEVMQSLNKEVLPLTNDEIPAIGENRADTMFYIYRDTMLYLDYLRQVMDNWAESA